MSESYRDRKECLHPGKVNITIQNNNRHSYSLRVPIVHYISYTEHAQRDHDCISRLSSIPLWICYAHIEDV